MALAFVLTKTLFKGQFSLTSIDGLSLCANEKHAYAKFFVIIGQRFCAFCMAKRGKNRNPRKMKQNSKAVFHESPRYSIINATSTKNEDRKREVKRWIEKGQGREKLSPGIAAAVPAADLAEAVTAAVRATTAPAVTAAVRAATVPVVTAVAPVVTAAAVTAVAAASSAAAEAAPDPVHRAAA